MTVKEMKEYLEGVPDDTPVVVYGMDSIAMEAYGVDVGEGQFYRPTPKGIAEYTPEAQLRVLIR